MRVSTKKRALPAAIRIPLLCVQHICAAVMFVMLVYMALSIGVVGDGLIDGERYYGINPFESASSFEESSTFCDIFEDYTQKAVLDTVISSQFGTTGDFDGSTLIDIVAYANRKVGNEEETNLSATYKLDDLLKWGMYGIEYETYTIKNLDDFYKIFPVLHEKGEKLSFEEAYEIIYTVANTYGVECRALKDPSTNQIYLVLSLPRERYELIGEHTSLKKLAGNWPEYCYLIQKHKSTIEDLAINFDTYQNIHKDLKEDVTNYRFYMAVTDKDGETSYFTNFSDGSNTTADTVKNIGEKYFIWNRNSVSYDTNMPMEVCAEIQSIFSRYEYALGENVQIYLTVDKDYTAADAFQMGLEKFVVTKDIWLYIGIAIACAIIWLLLFLYLSVMTGRKKVDGETQIVLHWFDYVPTEIAAAICILVVIGLGYMFVELSYSFGDFMTWYTYQEDDLMLLMVALVSGALSILFTFFWYSLLRRLKAKTIIKHSLIFRFLCWVFRGVKKVYNAIRKRVEYIYTNSKDASKVIWPAVILMALHFIVVPFGGALVVIGSEYGGIEALVGLLICGVVFVIDALAAFAILKDKVARTEIMGHIERITNGEMDLRLDEGKYKGENLRLAQSVNNIGYGIKTAVETSMKDERMKADLITNVSHDIKTPLTSIINYVDLLKREHIETEPIKGYIEVLDAKSQRLKQLTDDLVEASKISSGNIVLQMECINLAVLLKQSLGEFSEKFESKRLTILENYGDGEHMIYADPRRMWRVIENLFNNIYKYALDGTRVYIDITPNEFNGKKQVLLAIKNISANQLHVRPDELTERFVRGDDSRTTEGSGLGLSIAKSLVEAQGGSMNIILDGDLFKIVLLFDESVKAEETTTKTSIVEMPSEEESE